MDYLRFNLLDFNNRIATFPPKLPLNIFISFLIVVKKFMQGLHRIEADNAVITEALQVITDVELAHLDVKLVQEC